MGYRGTAIQDRIISLLEKTKQPLSTKDIAEQIDVSWHPARFHCAQLQAGGKIDCYKIGAVNVWFLSKTLSKNVRAKDLREKEVAA